MPAAAPPAAPSRSGTRRDRRHRVTGAARRVVRRGALLPAATAGLLVLALLPQAAQASGASYVALGDSYTAGPLIPGQDGPPAGCLRSAHDYPAAVAPPLGASAFTA